MPSPTISNWKSQFSSEVLKRLCIYLRDLKSLRSRGETVVSSNVLAGIINVSPVQIRKDLSHFGEFGKRGVGYHIDSLVSKLERILGLDVSVRVAVAGVGKLGSAIMRYPGFAEFNIRIGAAFDVSPEKIGKTIHEVRIEPLEAMETIIRERDILTGVICVPAHSAQQVADMMAASGVKTVMNFAPVKLRACGGVYVLNVDMAVELKTLVCLATERFKRMPAHAAVAAVADAYPEGDDGSGALEYAGSKES